MALPLLPSSLRDLLEHLERLPGVGPKSAQRIAFHLLRVPTEAVARMAESLRALHGGVLRCVTCGMLAEREECGICSDRLRNRGLLCVVEGPLDVVAIERTGEYHGRYHVLGGLLSPLDRVGPEDVNIPTLLDRVRKEHPAEVILALNPSTEGEATTLYLKKLLAEERVPLSRLAQGLPTGAALEFADDLTITRAIAGRQVLRELQK
jgi:recombination protein RecR